MATPNISINPFQTTNFPGTFSVDSTGWVQGIFVDDPAIRFQLAGGFVASSETTPMWGGIAVAAAVPNPASQTPQLGYELTRAGSIGAIDGFTVFNQAIAMVQTPQSRVPMAGSNMEISFFKLGSKARIVVQADAAFAATLEGNAISQQVAWDTTNQKLIAYSSGTALPVKVLGVNVGNSKIVSYASGTNFANWTNDGSTVLIEL